MTWVFHLLQQQGLQTATQHRGNWTGVWYVKYCKQRVRVFRVNPARAGRIAGPRWRSYEYTGSYASFRSIDDHDLAGLLRTTTRSLFASARWCQLINVSVIQPSPTDICSSFVFARAYDSLHHDSEDSEVPLIRNAGMRYAVG